jgi:predicted SAM-dependent methyltransferase
MLDADADGPLVYYKGQRVARIVYRGNQFVLEHLAPLAPADLEVVKRELALIQVHFKSTVHAWLFEQPSLRINRTGNAFVPSIDRELLRRVHLGCGNDVRKDWLNVDYFWYDERAFDPARNLLNLDLRNGIELPSETVSIFYSCHFLEHLTYDETAALAAACFRALVPGGRFRAMLPDFRKVVREYVTRDAAAFRLHTENEGVLNFLPPHQRGHADLLSRAVYEFYDHKYIWDPENLGMLLTAAGFVRVQEVDYDPELDNPDPARRAASFQLEAFKPDP